MTTITYASNDFDDIMASLISFMKTDNEFKDMNWDGAGIRAILRVLAFNSQNQAFQNNMMLNELDLNTGDIRENVASAAAALGYLATGYKAAEIPVQIVVTPKNLLDADNTLVMKKNTTFFATKDGVALTFSPADEYNAPLVDGVYTFDNVLLKQGVWTYNSFTVQSEFGVESYTLPNAQIDIDTMTVAVRDSVSASTFDVYRRFETAFDLSADELLYYLRANRTGLFDMEFGDDHISKKLSFGNIITVESLVTDGPNGNGVLSILPSSGVGGYFDVVVNNIDGTRSYGGALPEDTETIRKLAPIVFATQGNAVNDSDYVGLTKKLYSEAGDVVAWGGELNDPPKFGFEAVAVKPKNSETLSPTQKAELVAILKARCVGSITPFIVDPEYTYLNVTSTIKYNTKATLLTEQALKNKVADYCKIYSSAKLEFFKADFVFQNLATFISNIDLSFNGSITDVSYEKHFVPELNFNGAYNFLFNHPLEEGSIVIEGFRVADADFTGYTYAVYDDGAGVLKQKKYKADGTTFVYPGNFGTVDYTNGIVRLAKFVPNSILNTFVTVRAASGTKDPSLTAVNNTILKINSVSTELVVKDD